MQCNKPYSDDYMIYDEITKHYVLTEKALIEKVGLNLRARMGERSLITPEIAIKSFNTTVSDMIYQFIHEHNINNEQNKQREESRCLFYGADEGT